MAGRRHWALALLALAVAVAVLIPQEADARAAPDKKSDEKKGKAAAAAPPPKAAAKAGKVEDAKKKAEPKQTPPKKDEKKKPPPSPPKPKGGPAKSKRAKGGDDLVVADPDKHYSGYWLNAVGPGGCRGEDWDQPKGWPLFKGRLTLDDCAQKCADNEECNAVHVLRPDVGGDGKVECLHFAHKRVINVERMGGFCYEMDDDRLKDEEEMPKVEKIDKMPKLVHLGKGRCRGPDWAANVWPILLDGRMTIEACGRECATRKRCLAFDLTEIRKGEGECALYGHSGVAAASAVEGECFSLKDRVDDARGHDDDDEEEEEEEEEDDDVIKENTPYKLLGKGACRGEGWADKHWPKDKGMVEFQRCADLCGGNKECTSFSVSEKKGSKMRCHLFRHARAAPASAVPGKCFTVKNVTDKKKKKAGGGKKGKNQKPKETHALLGPGLCRGPKWASKHWPKDLGRRGLESCFKACQKSAGCTAFDLTESKNKRKKSACLLYGHTEVVAASAASPLPAQCHVMADEDEDDDDVDPDDLEGHVKVKLIGQGACRGLDWQKGKWPLVKGFQSIEDCGKLCLATKKCRAFHIAEPHKKAKGKFQCYLFGHRGVKPASGVPGACFKAEGKVKVSKEAARRKEKEKEDRKKRKNKKLKVPEFDPPEVLPDNFEGSEDDEEWLFEPPPPKVRSREHIPKILGLDREVGKAERELVSEALESLKDVYEDSIRPLEEPYRYPDLANRHFGDAEIFGRPLVVLMGPYSGGKSTMINYLLGTEFTKNAFRSSAEPSPGFNFNIAMYGKTEEELTGSELVSEWAFSNLERFGQQFLKKIRAKKMPNKLLERATFAEIPGVLETGSRKVDRAYPFHDACQWFIDHADLILLVYDYAKLDIGPEAEALLDQLKGRESQVRIILNKADEITAEELLKIQGNLVWNVSPLMSGASLEPPAVYAGSFWSRPYQEGAPKRLLAAQERSLLEDLRQALDSRVESRLAVARRFAVRVRNHAKMVDCYLSAYHNNRGLLFDSEDVASDVAAHPDKYHIYDALTASAAAQNVSRYDLPDPAAYAAFFSSHPLPSFPTLRSLCGALSAFRKCPINRLEAAIAYELPDILAKYKKGLRELGLGKNKKGNK